KTHTSGHMIIELMRQGKTPQQACEEAVARVLKLMAIRKKDPKDIQVGFIALNKLGEHGAYCVQSGFNYAIHDASGNKLIDAGYHLAVPA
ncbi:MAG: glycosylasparaginase, partial [Bacteroidota bacterium]